MTHSYSEDQLVEQPAISLFAVLGWQTISAQEESFGIGGTLGRETKSEAILLPRLRAALVKFNPSLPPEAISNALDELSRDRSAMSLEAANREVYRLLKEGITVSVPNREQGGQKTERLHVMDWQHPERNDFLLVSQFSVTGARYTCRPDLVGFVNGLPWVVIELKKPGVPARAAFDENLSHYKQQIPALSLFTVEALNFTNNSISEMKFLQQAKIFQISNFTSIAEAVLLLVYLRLIDYRFGSRDVEMTLDLGKSLQPRGHGVSESFHRLQ